MLVSERALRRLTVLKAIRSAGSISRSELPHRTGLSGATITEVSAELLSRGIIEETKDAVRRTGRPRTLLKIRASGRVVIGANLAGGNRLTAAIVDFRGNQQFTTDLTLAQASCLEELASSIAHALQAVIAEASYKGHEIAGVGIAVPAIVDSRDGTIHHMTAFPEAPFPFADAVSEVLGLPVTIEKEAVCMARAEHWFGRAQGLDTFTLIHLGLWLGSAEYVNAAPRIGASGFALELGHCATGADEHALLCTCGAYGCLATYCSMHGIVAQAGQLGDKLFLWPSELRPRFERLLEDAGSGGKARALFDRAGRQLGIALAAYVNTVDPGNILLLYSHQRFFELIRPSYEKELHAHALGAVLRQTRIEAAPVDEQWRLTGTAALALEQAFVNRMAA